MIISSADSARLDALRAVARYANRNEVHLLGRFCKTALSEIHNMRRMRQRIGMPMLQRYMITADIPNFDEMYAAAKASLNTQNYFLEIPLAV